MGSASTLQLIRHASMVPIGKLAPTESYGYLSPKAEPIGWEPGDPDPILHGLAVSLEGLPWAAGEVNVRVLASAQLDNPPSITRWLYFWYGEVHQKVFVNSGLACADPHQAETFTIPAADWNAQLQPDGTGAFQMEIRIEPSYQIHYLTCGGESWARFRLDYGGGPSPDAMPPHIGWRTFAPVLRNDGTMGHLEGEWKFDPVTGCLVVQIESQNKVTYGGLNASPVVAVAGRPDTGCVESFIPYEIRGSVVRLSTAGKCPEE